MDDQLVKIRDWAQGTLDDLKEPPWATRRSQIVIVMIDEMLACESVSVSCDKISCRSLERSSRRLLQGDNIIQIDSARRRRTANLGQR